jgi:hypothetical protein
MRAHVINNGIVVNTIEVASLDFIAGLVNGENGGAIGDLFDGFNYIPQSPDLLKIQSAAIKQIDADVDAIYGAVTGNRTSEYTRARDAAQVYKDAGYTGAVPSSVQGWATAKGWTATQAADDILATAAAWIAAQDAIRNARLLRKEQVRAATDKAGIGTALAAWAAFVVYIKGQLGVP